MRNPTALGEGTRRTFLRTTGTLALGGMALDATAHAAGSDRIRVGLIGCGDRGTGAAFQALKTGPDVALVAMADVFADRAASSRAYLREQFPEQCQVADGEVLVGFEGYRAVIERSDVVLIACASKFHPFYAGAAIEAGKHVFVEKPHGIDPAGVRRMQEVCDLARSRGLSIQSGLQSRYHAGWREAVQRIHDGAIGDIVAIQAMFLRGPYRLSPREPERSETEYQFRNWYHFRWLSGDDVSQSLVHNMDRVSWILKEQTPEWAFGLAGRSASFGVEYGDMFDHHTVVYEYPGGARVYALCRTQNGCYNNASDIVMGTRGTCHLSNSRIEGENPWRYEGPQNDPYQDEQQALFDAVRTGTPINAGSYMATSTRIAVMGQMACYDGRPQKWEDVLHSELQFGPSPEESSFATPPPTSPDATGNYPLPLPGVTRIEDLHAV